MDEHPAEDGGQDRDTDEDPDDPESERERAVVRSDRHGQILPEFAALRSGYRDRRRRDDLRRLGHLTAKPTSATPTSAAASSRPNVRPLPEKPPDFDGAVGDAVARDDGEGADVGVRLPSGTA
jgi:hypothetical protein